MRMLAESQLCPDSHQPCQQKCQGKCAGYGTTSNCPPLIVLAVLATSPVVFNAGCTR